MKPQDEINILNLMCIPIYLKMNRDLFSYITNRHMLLAYLARAISLGLRLAANIEVNLLGNKFNLYNNPGTLPQHLLGQL